MRSCTCPNCNANLSYDETSNREFMFCEFCGAKVLLDDFRTSHHIVDEAKIKQAETERIIKLKQLEIEQREREYARIEKEKKQAMIRKVGLIVGIIFAVAIIICLLSGNSTFAIILAFVAIIGVAIVAMVVAGNPEDKKRKDGLIKFPDLDIEEKKPNYLTIQETLRGCGFKNVKCVSMADVKLGLLVKTGSVETVMINGKKKNKGGGWYDPEAQIVIQYHGK